MPHPEVDLILIDGVPVDFAHQLQADVTIEVFPVAAPADLSPDARLQRRGRQRFVADGHLGKLVRDLRLLGIDVAYARDATDAELVAQAVAEERALLTRDRRLLMHAAVRDGYYPGSQLPEEQTREVLRRFGLRPTLAPHTRCLTCNGLLEPVSKAEVLDQLEPLTRVYYNKLLRCRACGKIHWAGSHFSRLEARLARFLAETPTP